MAILEILTYPNSQLAIPSTPVERFDGDLKKLVGDMAETMYAADGIGLAAPQVNVHKNIFVIDIHYVLKEGTPNLLVFINPKISNLQGKATYKEGCLSVPGIYEDVERAESISLEYHDVEGSLHTENVTDLLATAIQHENDHLLGRLFIDRLSFVKSRSVKRKIKKGSLS